MSLRLISTSWNNHIYIKYTLYEWYDNSNFVVHQMGALMAVYSQDNLQNDFYKKKNNKHKTQTYPVLAPVI